MRSLAQNLLSDRKYLDNLRKRLNDGKLPPAVETMLWHYAYGRPAERHSFAGPDEGPTELRISVVDKRKVPSSYEESLAREKDDEAVFRRVFLNGATAGAKCHLARNPVPEHCKRSQQEETKRHSEIGGRNDRPALHVALKLSKLTFIRSLELAIEVAEGLAAAHAKP